MKAWQPTPVFLPGDSQGQRSLVGTVHGITKSQTQLKGFSIHVHITLLYNKIYTLEVSSELRLFAITSFLLIFYFCPERLSVLEVYSLIIVFANSRQITGLRLNFPFPRRYFFCSGQRACLVHVKKLSGSLCGHLSVEKV